MANPIKSLRESLGKIPTKYRFWTSLAILAALLIALPVTLIGLMTGTFELRKRALTFEPEPTATPSACIQECEIAIVYPDAPDCCSGLERRTRFQIDEEGNCQPLFGGVICLGGCGDGQCLSCEDYCNCPEDCGSVPPSCESEYFMIWYDGQGNIARQDPYILSEDACVGLRCLSNNNEISPSCYNPAQCSTTCSGQCINIRLWQELCGYGLTPTPTPTPTPTSTVSSSIFLKIRFGGVTSRPIDDSSKNLKIYATSLSGGPDLGSANYKLEVPFIVDDAGIYSMEIGLDGSYFGHRYRLRIKGPKHLQSVFPDVYFQPRGEIDLTYAPLRPGDLDQDGDVDINDLRAIKVFSTDPADIAFGDVNFDGKLSVFDRGLILITLSVQYDPD